MQALVSVIMGSKSDWETMAHAAEMLDKLGVPCEVRVLSAHRTPDQLFDYVKAAEGAGVEVFIAAAGGAAPLGGVGAAKTLRPGPGAPDDANALHERASLLSIGPMPTALPLQH